MNKCSRKFCDNLYTEKCKKCNQSLCTSIHLNVHKCKKEKLNELES